MKSALALVGVDRPPAQPMIRRRLHPPTLARACFRKSSRKLLLDRIGELLHLPPDVCARVFEQLLELRRPILET